MGSNKVKENGNYRENEKITNSDLVIFFLSLVMCTVGGSVLGWWFYNYHPTNRQLWMVPFGLIFFLTPVTVWFSLAMSDICSSKREEEGMKPTCSSKQVLMTQRDVNPSCFV